MNLSDGEVVRLQPRGYRSHIRVGRAEAAPEFLRLEPFVKRGASRRVRSFNEIPEFRLLSLRALEQQEHTAGGQGVFHGALIEPGLGHGMHAATQDYPVGFIHGTVDTRGNPRKGG